MEQPWEQRWPLLLLDISRGGIRPGFQVTGPGWRGCSNGGKNQNPRQSLRLSIKPKKVPGSKLTPKKSHAEFPSLKNFQKVLNNITRKIKCLITCLVVLYSQSYAAGDTQALRTTTNTERRETPSRRGHFHGQNRKQSLLGSLYWDFTETGSRAWKVSGTEGNEPMEHKSRQVNKRESFVEKANNCHSSIKFMAEMTAAAKLTERCTGIADVKGSNPVVQAWIFFSLSFRNCTKLRTTAMIILHLKRSLSWTQKCTEGLDSTTTTSNQS